MSLVAQNMLAAGQIWLYLLPSVGSMLLFYGIWQVVTESRVSNQKKMQDRLRGERSREDKVVASIVRRSSGTTQFADVIFGKFRFVPKLQILLDQADLDWNASKMVLNLAGGAILTAVILIAFGIKWVAGIGIGFGIVILPLVWISMRRKWRMTKLCNQLPDVFEMMSQALRAGHSLAGAIQLIYEQMPAPIATEFAQVYHEQNLGVRVEDALQAMADRVDSLDIRFFVTAVMIQRQTGGDLAEVLDNISGVIRERIELAGLVRGLTAEGRLSGWVLFALPALVFVASMYLNPAYARVLLEDPRGQIMLMIAAGMQLMGIAMIRWIVNIKV
ncbi:MAG: type II secretion system F family protein [Planctomycetes bacterium]|nr:type II secretion system F family protein [Planctomycetota bacterium]MBI3835561.1 type II secretion system F family protein [Planctomycetota bacterium]